MFSLQENSTEDDDWELRKQQPFPLELWMGGENVPSSSGSALSRNDRQTDLRLSQFLYLSLLCLTRMLLKEERPKPRMMIVMLPLPANHYDIQRLHGEQALQFALTICFCLKVNGAMEEIIVSSTIKTFSFARYVEIISNEWPCLAWS